MEEQRAYGSGIILPGGEQRVQKMQLNLPDARLEMNLPFPSQGSAIEAQLDALIKINMFILVSLQKILYAKDPKVPMPPPPLTEEEQAALQEAEQQKAITPNFQNGNKTVQPNVSRLQDRMKPRRDK